MIYNEYAQVLEATNPETGQLYQPTDLNVINWNDEGSAMLQDALFARAAWLAEPGNEDVATRFLKASFQGWIYCRENPADCIQYTVNAGSQLGAGHQAWMMNEINPLVWPSPGGIGMMDPALWQQTVDVSIDAGDHHRRAAGRRLPDGPRRGGAGRARRRRHEGRVLREGHGGGDPGRELSGSSRLLARRTVGQIRTAGRSRGRPCSACGAAAERAHAARLRAAAPARAARSPWAGSAGSICLRIVRHR